MSSDAPEVIAGLLRRAAAEQPLWLTTTGASMLPTIRPGERVLVHDRPPQFGQVGAFVNRFGTVTVHRYLGRLRNRHLLLGDNRRDLDGLVDDDRLVGSVTDLDRGGHVAPLLPQRMRLALRAIPALARSAWRRFRP